MHVPYNERKKWDYLWIVDPLDGTKEFIKKNGEFTVNIALVKKQKPILGVIYVPCSNELYYALEGLGAFKATIDGSYKGLERLLKNSSKLPLNQNRSNFIVVGSRSHMSNETQKYFDAFDNLACCSVLIVLNTFTRIIRINEYGSFSLRTCFNADKFNT